MKTPRKVKLLWAHYPHQNQSIAREFTNICRSFDAVETKREFRILQNLIKARSNYLNSKQKAPKLTKRYQNSLQKAVNNAKILLDDIKNTPCANIFGIHISIEQYIQNECEKHL